MMNIVSLKTRLEHRLVLPVRAHWRTDRVCSHGDYMQIGPFPTTIAAPLWEWQFLRAIEAHNSSNENPNQFWTFIGPAALAALGGQLAPLPPLTLEPGQIHYVIEDGQVASLATWELEPDLDIRGTDPIEAVKKFGYSFRKMARRGIDDLPT